MSRALALAPRALPSLIAVGLGCSATLCAQDRRAALDQAVRDLPVASAPASPAAPTFRLVDVSLNALVAAGASTERDTVLQRLQGGGHDPRKRGFTVQNVELSLQGAVDPYFTAETHLVSFLDPIEGETVVELEEAFLTTTSLPAGLQVEVGTFFTEFGRLNPRHPHAWDWQDQPVVNTRFFGPDGMRGPGVRLGWLLPTTTFNELHIGVQNANGETMASFLANEDFYGERPIAGRQFVTQETNAFDDLVYLVRANTGFDLDGEQSMQIGVSALFGPNATGGKGHTAIYGIDAVYRWRATNAERGWPFVKVEGEVIGRRFHSQQQVDANDPLDLGDDVVIPGDTLDDWGAYLQALYGFRPQWAVGLRGEWATGSGDSYDADRDTLARAGDIFRADRFRIAPLLAYHPSEFSRVRLQYNFDDTDAVAKQVHSVWLGFEVNIGQHPPHKY